MDASPQQVFRFGEFELDVAAFRLSRAGQPVRLERRPMELLRLLVERRGQLVTREQIIEKLWGGKVVIDFDTGLNTLVRKVRQALGDSSEQPTYVETVTGKGYRFAAPVTVASPEADAAQPKVAELAPMPARRSRWIAVAAAALAALGLALVLWRNASIGSDRITVAVLPFDNLTAQREHDYLAAGLAEDTVASLGKIDPAHLQIVGPASAMSYARGGRPLTSIDDDLGVDYVVRSVLRIEGSQLRVTSSLIRATDQVQLWSAAFDRELTSTLGLQRDLSAAIAEQVKIRVSAERAAEIDRRQTPNPLAYDHYLRGRHAWMQLTPAGTRAALEHYQRAIEIDPDYALAWAGTAYALTTAPMNGDAQPSLVYEQARTAAERALAIAPSLAEAHLARGYVSFMLERNFPAAEQSFRNAAARDPNSALAHLLQAHVLSQQGEHVEARTLVRRARELDPFFAHTYAISSKLAFQARDLASAIEFARQAIAINPEFWVGYIQLGQALEQQNDVDGALIAFDAAHRLSGGNSKAVSLRGYVLSRAGRREEALTALREIEEKARTHYMPPYASALIHAGLGDADAAFAQLKAALAAGDVHLIFLPVDPKWDPLRNDPRFTALIERSGLDGGGAAQGM